MSKLAMPEDIQSTNAWEYKLFRDTGNFLVMGTLWSQASRIREL